MTGGTAGFEKEKEALQDILSGSEFTAYLKESAEPGQNLLLLWLKRLLEALGELFPQAEMPKGTSELISYGIIGFGLLLLLLLSLFLLRLLWVERRSDRRKAIALEEELEQAPEDLAGRSRAAAAAGDYREAVRLLFLALLLGFQRRELLRVEAWKTNGEYAEELEEKDSRWVPMFRESALRFDTVWYGGRSIGAEEYDEWRERVEAAIAAVLGGGGEAA